MESNIQIDNYNSIMNEAQLQKVVLEGTPIGIMFSTGTRCNQKCYFCIDREGKELNSFDFMSYSLFLKVTKKLQTFLERTTWIHPLGWGEPLLNTNLPKILNFLNKNYENAFISITTNGTILTRKWINRLLRFQKVQINISLNAATRRTYMKITGGDYYEKVISNIKFLIHTIRYMNNYVPIIRLILVLVKDNVRELPKFVDLAASLGINTICFVDLMIFRDEHQQYSMAKNPEVVENYFKRALLKANIHGINVVSFILAPYFRFECSGASIVKTEYDYNCYEPWFNFRVGESGNVSPCCYSNEIMGNIFNQDPIEIWNGDRYQELRSRINTVNPPNICSNCIVKKEKIDLSCQMHSDYRINWNKSILKY